MKKFRLEIKWALIFVAMSLLWMLFEKLGGLHSTHIDKHIFWTNLFAIPVIIVYALALMDKNKNDYNGQMTFKQGLISGLIITVIATIFAPITQWIISTIITPEYFPNVIAYWVETGYHKTIEEAEAYFSLKNYIVQSTIGTFIMGVILSVIVAFFVRTKFKKTSVTHNVLSALCALKR